MLENVSCLSLGKTAVVLLLAGFSCVCCPPGGAVHRLAVRCPVLDLAHYKCFRVLHTFQGVQAHTMTDV